MKIVVAFEGVDGAGKTTLTGFTRRLCEQHRQRYTLIARHPAFAAAAVGRLTRLLHDEADNLNPRADALLRMAREYQRADLAAAAAPGVVVFDRFVLSILSLARFHGLEVDPILRLLYDIAARAHLHATFFVQCPFETAQSRMVARARGRPMRRIRDDHFHRRMAELMEEDFRRGHLTGQQWLVDNSGSLEVAEAQVAAYLLPYFQKG